MLNRLRTPGGPGARVNVWAGAAMAMKRALRQCVGAEGATSARSYNSEPLVQYAVGTGVPPAATVAPLHQSVLLLIEDILASRDSEHVAA